MASEFTPAQGSQGETQARIHTARTFPAKVNNARDGPAAPDLHGPGAPDPYGYLGGGPSGELLLPFGGGGVPAPLSAAERIQRMAQRALIDLDKAQPEPERFLTLTQGGETFTLGTAGNFSLITGKAKSRKTFFTTMLMAAALGGESGEGMIRGHIPYYQDGVFLFDTEQGDHHVQMTARRVLALAGHEQVGWFEAYSLRSYSPADRLAVIEHLLASNEGVGLVVIDGIRDLVTSINDEEQASMLMGKLMAWSKELNIHIVVVLHQNKGDNNARGHLGTEANNKAETVISITLDGKDKGFSTAKAEYSREPGFSPFSFTVNEEGLPVIAERASSAEDKAAKRGKREIPPETMQEILGRIFDKHPKPKLTELAGALRKQAEEAGYPISDTKAKALISNLSANRTLGFEGKKGTRHGHYVLGLPS